MAENSGTYTHVAIIAEYSLGKRFCFILAMVTSNLLLSFSSASHGGGLYSGVAISLMLLVKLSFINISVPPPFWLGLGLGLVRVWFWFARSLLAIR